MAIPYLLQTPAALNPYYRLTMIKEQLIVTVTLLHPEPIMQLNGWTFASKRVTSFTIRERSGWIYFSAKFD